MMAAECPDRAVGDLPEIAGGYRRSMSMMERDRRHRIGGSKERTERGRDGVGGGSHARKEREKLRRDRDKI